MHSEIAQGRGKGANDIEAFLRSIEGVILLASPSNGSKLAVYASKALKMAASTSGSNSVLFNPAHVESLMPNDPELKQITTNFDKYCVWYKDKQGRPLKVAAFRETKGMFKVPRLGFTKVKVCRMTRSGHQSIFRLREKWANKDTNSYSNRLSTTDPATYPNPRSSSSMGRPRTLQVETTWRPQRSQTWRMFNLRKS